MDANIADYLDFARELAHRVGNELRVRRQAAVTELNIKDNKTLLTDVDLWAHHEYVTAITGAYPDHPVVTEEGEAGSRGSAKRWIIDPLDGTTNFANNSPIYGTSVALYENDQPLLGVIYMPELNILVAESANEKKRKVDNNRPVNLHQVIFDRGGLRTDDEVDVLAKVHANLVKNTRTVRMFGSASYSLVALCEGYDAFIGCRMAAHDIAAGVIFAKNRGLSVASLSGQDFVLNGGQDIIIASDDAIKAYRDILANSE